MNNKFYKSAIYSKSRIAMILLVSRKDRRAGE